MGKSIKVKKSYTIKKITIKKFTIKEYVKIKSKNTNIPVDKVRRRLRKLFFDTTKLIQTIEHYYGNDPVVIYYGSEIKKIISNLNADNIKDINIDNVMLDIDMDRLNIFHRHLIEYVNSLLPKWYFNP